MKQIDYSKFPDCETEYIKIWQNSSLQKKWDVLYNEITSRRKINIYPKDVNKILIADFSLLNKIYLDSKNLSSDEKNAAKKIFNYDFKASDFSSMTTQYKLSTITASKKYSTDIANFFITNSIKLQISTCYYCEMNYVFPYKAVVYNTKTKKFEKQQKRMFDLDHFFEKKDSPITSLSLYNLIPSCQVCNSRIKNKRSIESIYHLDNQKDLTDFKYVSPSSILYNFDKKVTIKIKENKVSNFSNLNNFSIKFETSDIDSERIISAFQLEERYNYDCIKLDSLNLLQLKRKCSQGRLKSIATYLTNNGEKTTEKELKNLIFNTNDIYDKSKIFAKLKRDILK